jgi:hypothetical protein
MINFAFLDTSGRYPVRLGSKQYLPDGAVELPKGIAAEKAVKMQFVDDAWIARPQVGAPTITVETGGTKAMFSGLPDGASAQITDIETNAVLGSALAEGGMIELLFAEPAAYLVEVSVPLPWIPWAGKITC